MAQTYYLSNLIKDFGDEEAFRKATLLRQQGNTVIVDAESVIDRGGNNAWKILDDLKNKGYRIKVNQSTLDNIFKENTGKASELAFKKGWQIYSQPTPQQAQQKRAGIAQSGIPMASTHYSDQEIKDSILQYDIQPGHGAIPGYTGPSMRAATPEEAKQAMQPVKPVETERWVQGQNMLQPTESAPLRVEPERGIPGRAAQRVLDVAMAPMGAGMRTVLMPQRYWEAAKSLSNALSNSTYQGLNALGLGKYDYQDWYNTNSKKMDDDIAKVLGPVEDITTIMWRNPMVALGLLGATTRTIADMGITPFTSEQKGAEIAGAQMANAPLTAALVDPVGSAFESVGDVAAKGYEMAGGSKETADKIRGLGTVAVLAAFHIGAAKRLEVIRDKVKKGEKLDPEEQAVVDNLAPEKSPEMVEKTLTATIDTATTNADVLNKVKENQVVRSAVEPAQQIRLAPEVQSAEAITSLRQEVPVAESLRKDAGEVPVRGLDAQGRAAEGGADLQRQAQVQPGYPEKTQVAPTDLAKMTQQEFADWLANNPKPPGTIYEILTLRPELRQYGINAPELYKATGTDSSITRQKSAELQKIWKSVAEGKAGTNENVKAIGQDSAGWNNFNINSGTGSPVETHKAYVTLKNPAELNQSMVVGLLNDVQDSGYNGQMKIPEVGSRLFYSFDNIVFHGRSLADAKLAADVAARRLGQSAEISFGLDKKVNGKSRSHTDLLAESVEARRKNPTPQPQQPPPGVSPEAQVTHTMPTGETMPGPEHPGAVPGTTQLTEVQPPQQRMAVADPISAAIQGVKQLTQPEPRPDLAEKPRSLYEDPDKYFEENKGIQLEDPSLWQKAKERITKIRQSFARSRPNIDPGASVPEAVAQETLRRFQDVPERAGVAAMDAIVKYTRELGPNRKDLLYRVIMLEDLAKDLETEKVDIAEKPLGYESVEQVANDLQNLRARMLSDPKTAEAYGRRQQLMRPLIEAMVEAGRLPEEVLDDPRYYHHQVLEHYTEGGQRLGSRDFRVHRKGIEMRRMGSAKNINTEGVESDFEWLSQAYTQLYTLEAQAKMKRAVDISGRLKMEREVIDEELSGTEDKSKLVGKMAKAKDRGNVGRIVAVNEQAGTATVHFVNREAGTQATVDMPLSDLSISKKGGITIPEGYVEWQVPPNHPFFKADTVPQRIVDQVTQYGEARIGPEDLGQVMAVGKGETWIVPENIAKELNNLSKQAPTNIVGEEARRINNAWKRWVILNPWRASKYMLNNMSGDLDALIGIAPGALRYAKKNSVALWNKMWKGKATPEFEQLFNDAMEKSLLQSGMTMEEIPDVKKLPALKLLNAVMNPNDPFWKRPDKMIQSTIEKYWRNINTLNIWRESVLRLSAYEYWKDKVNSGNRRYYGASDKSTINQMYDAVKEGKLELNDVAARLARDTLGDYGNISAAGQWMRRTTHPFWSWVEINVPRYYHLFKNLAEEGRGKELAGAATVTGARLAGKVGWKAAKVYAATHALFALVNAYNKTVYPEDDRAINKAKGELYLITPFKNDDGSRRVVRFSGALSDALDMFGLRDYTRDIGDLAEGKLKAKDEAWRVMTSVPENLWQRISPFIKAPAEIGLQRQTYPRLLTENWPQDVTDLKQWFTTGRPVRSGAQQIWKYAALDWVYNTYRKATGRPMPGRDTQLWDMLSTTVDTNQANYYAIREKTYDFLRERGEAEPPPSQYKDKANAAYFFKVASQIDDKDAAKYWFKEYMRLSQEQWAKNLAYGKEKKDFIDYALTSLNKSIEYSSPLGALPEKYRAQFLQSLTPEEHEQLNAAMAWYHRKLPHKVK